MTSVDVLTAKTIKVGDTEPPLRVQLLTPEGNPYNIEGMSVDVRMKRSDADELLLNTAATVENASRGIVSYDWALGDTDTSGTYVVEFTASDLDRSVTFPNDNYEKIYIEDRLG